MYPEQPGQSPTGQTPPPSGPFPPQSSQPTQWNTSGHSSWGQPQSTPYSQQQWNTPQPQPQPQPAQQWSQQPAAPSPAYSQPAQPLTPNGMASIDYLNQIAPTTKGGGGFSRKQIAIIGGILLLAFAVVAVLALANGGQPSTSALSQRLVAKTVALEDAATKSQVNIKSRDLSSVNSNLTLQLTTMNADLKKTLAPFKIDPAKIDKSILAAESNKALLDKLEDARLNSTFDRVYAREMGYQLETTLILMKNIYTTTTNAEYKKQLETTYNNLEPLQKQFATFDSAKS